MGDPLVTPAVVSFPASGLLKRVIENAKSVYRHGDLCKELADRLVKIEPIVTRLQQSASNFQHGECIKWLTHFQEILARAHALINDCSQESKLDKTRRMVKFWRWKKLPSLLAKINVEILKANADVPLYILDVFPSTNVRESLGFAQQATPSLIVGVEEHFNELKSSILQSHGRVDAPSTFGLQGRGGAGKTLLAQMLNNDTKVKETYGEDSIIWITVGLDASVGDLYECMANCKILDRGVSEKLKLFPTKEDQRKFLMEAFSKKKVLLILDDVWDKQYEHHNMMYWLDVAKAPGSTLLITTRNETILRRARAKTSVVLSLDDDDSWELFSSHAFVGDATSLEPIPKELARSVCKECKGLPLALKVIGSAMMDKMSTQEWKLASLDLQQSRPISDASVDDELFGRLQLSYKELKSTSTRICFLYFAAFPEDHKIEVEDLIDIWVGEELFGANLNIKEATMRAYDHLRTLEKRSLIEWNQEEGYARIHDILRDLALYIIDNAKAGECAYECLFYSKKASISFPASERVVGLKRMSFMNCKISQWPEDLENVCLEVKVCIFRNTSIMDVGAFVGFFKNMINLRVLDLSQNLNVSQDLLRRITSFAQLRKLSLSKCDSLRKLPKSIGNLKRLTKLDLSNCPSLTRLPEGIGNLKCLTELDLSYCGSLTGLPKSIDNLKRLTELDLRDCGSLTGLPESIGNLKCLTELDLSYCRSLTGLPESIGNLECLKKLDLLWCGSLTGLPESIGNLECLTKLDLSWCGSLAGLPESIGNLKCLTELDLSYCGSVTGLPESIGNLKYLTELDLRDCGSLTGLPESIGNLECLTKLDLLWCGSLTRLPESINNLKCLTELDLRACGSLTGLPESIGNLECLTKLDLSYCGSLTGLPESIGNLKCLTELDLRNCGSLTGLPESIGNLECLTKLDLSWCGPLTGLPESIGNLKCLTELDLSYCGSLTGLPKSISNLKCLTELDLRDCGSLTGLPESIGNLECLTKLDLSWCGSLTGLPKSIGNLQCVTKLDLRDCGSLTRLPESIGNLKCLTELDLSYCGSLTGLPESIGNLKCLTKLDLRDCGSLMELLESIGNLKCLTELDLSYCGSLTGLPESIGNLECLKKLDLLWCGSLTGLPESIGNLECLTKLDLSWCGSLTGLPESIGNLKCLTELDLRDCGSLTRLPESIGNLECVTELDLLWCGSLTGLPESIGNLECLTKLDLSWCGSLAGLPESIGNLKCLTELDLSYCGSLTGLPESIGNLKCLTELDLSYCGSVTGLPENIGNLECLTKLDLRDCGSLTRLPESIGNLECLTKLDLSWCGSLAGLPESIGNLKCLTELDLRDCGSLTGLPESIGNLKCLTELDLSYCRSLTGLLGSIGNVKFQVGTDDMGIEDAIDDDAQECKDELSAVADFQDIQAANAVGVPSSSTIVLEDQTHELEMPVDVDKIEFQVEKDVTEGVSRPPVVLHENAIFGQMVRPNLISDELQIDLTKDLLGVSFTGYVIRTSCSGMQGQAQPCALKRINVMNTNGTDLARLDHLHIVQLIDHWVEEKFLFLIMELMDGDLAKLMARTKKPRASPFTLHVTVDLMLQIALGMRYLHEMDVSHPHLKCENVLYMVAEAEAYQVGDRNVLVKLGGFGWSRPTDVRSKNRDVVCFGQTCLEILTGNANSEMVNKSSIPETTPAALKNCIVGCLDTQTTFENVVEELLRAKSYIVQCCKDETICSSEVIQTKIVSTKTDDILDEIFTVHQLHPEAGDASTSIRATLVLFHGFHKVPEEWRRTWMTRDNKLVWPQKWLPEDLGSQSIRVLSVSFDANSNVSNKYNRHEMGKNLVERLILSPRWKLGEIGEAVFLIGHSFGGVLIKSFVTEAQSNAQERDKCLNFLDNLAEVVFYSVPHAALTPVEFEDYISVCRKVVPLQRSSFLKSLREDIEFIADMCKLSVDFERALPENVKVLAFLEGKPMSMRGVLVTEKSFEGLSRSWECHKIDKDNHFEVSRPESKSHIGYKILLDHLLPYMV